jgi:hypothetical protein
MLQIDLKKLAEDALTAAYEKGLGDHSEDREAWTLREAVAKIAKKELLDGVECLDKENKRLRAKLSNAQQAIEDMENDKDYKYGY